MQKQDAWARFWQGGSLTSFGDRFAGGYEGELRAFWADFFATLPPRSVVADFGAGNGALEEIARQYSIESSQPLTIHAIDLAPQLPARFAESAATAACNIIWHPGTPNEATGLEDASVDAVIGNYAFEYGDGEKSIREIARILKSHGRCRFLMHHSASTAITGAAVELKVLDAMLQKSSFLDAVRDYLREFGDIRRAGQFEKLKKSGKAEPLRKRMNETHQNLTLLAIDENAVLLIRQVAQWTGQLVSPPMFFEPRQVLLERLKEIRDELEANRIRLRDMQAAAVNADRMARIVEIFRSHGMIAAAAPFHVSLQPAPVGWAVDATRD